MGATRYETDNYVFQGAQEFQGPLTLQGLLKLGGSNYQTLTGAGAVDITHLVTRVVTTGAQALTLADGVEGQLKIITMITDGGDGTLTPTNLTPGATITFNDAGDSVILYFAGGEWRILANQGCTLG